MRKGFTLLEILIVMAVMSFATVSLVTSFGQSQERVEFQQKANEIASSISAARASAVSNDSGSDNVRIVTLELGGNQIVSYIENGTNNEYTSEVDTLIKELTLSDIAEINSADVLRKVTVDGMVTSEWIPVEQPFIRLFFYPSTNSCDFTLNANISGELTVNSNDSMIILNINRPEEDPVRFLSFHKKSCLPELLSSSPAL